MKYLLIIAISLLLTGCNEKISDMTDFYKVYGGEDAETYLNKISGQVVIFGHQSVGNNILSGVTSLEEETGVKLNRVTTRDFSNHEGPAFLDFPVGENGNSFGKIDDFVSMVKAIPTETNAIAFFKLCYVDVLDRTDVEELFSYYKKEMLNLKDSVGHIRIVLFTVPLTTIQKGWKPVVKKILGRESTDPLDNIKRQAFNEMLLKEMSGEFAVFDLARVESTLPGGEISSFKSNGKVYPCLSQVYASDNGHLNEFGSKVVAYNLLAFLSEEL
jgi:hypothetical protein